MRATVGVAVFKPMSMVMRGMATSASPKPREDRTNVEQNRIISTAPKISGEFIALEFVTKDLV
jgi:hypothetical protein